MTEDSLCGGCRSAGVCRLGVRHWRPDTAGASVRAVARCPPQFAGGPGIAHGGWTAGVFDDVLGRLVRALGGRGVTAQLHVAYHRPAPVGMDLDVNARVTATLGRRREVTGELTYGSGAYLLASARAVLVEVDEGHVHRYQDWLRRHGTAQVTGPPDLGPMTVTPSATAPPHTPAEPDPYAGLLDDWQL